jgi:hypothetical protein
MLNGQRMIERVEFMVLSHWLSARLHVASNMARGNGLNPVARHGVGWFLSEAAADTPEGGAFVEREPRIKMAMLANIAYPASNYLTIITIVDLFGNLSH